jgi:hypothetical protein
VIKPYVDRSTDVVVLDVGKHGKFAMKYREEITFQVDGISLVGASVNEGESPMRWNDALYHP